jgi:putative nucleotidyltransferase with HDIG domain
MTVALAATGVGEPAPWLPILTLGALALCAEKQPVRVSANVEMTVSVLPILFAAVVYGPIPAMCVTAIGLAADLRRPVIRWTVWTAYRCTSAGLAGVAAQLLLPDDRSFGAMVIVVAFAGVVEACADTAFGAITIAVRRSGSLRALLRTMLPMTAATVPFHALVITLLAYAHAEFSVWTLFLFVAPAFAAQSLYRLYWRERVAREALRETNARLERANLSFAHALVSALDARDRYTAGHSAAVAVYARDLARELNLPEADQELAHLSGLLHDIGKVGLPPGLLEKPGALTTDERRVMEQHAEIGARILGNVEDYRAIATIVRHHHERIDGNGYPGGLIGDSIPLIAKIIAVADAYNAMTSGRSYRDALGAEVALARIREGAGSQFDCHVVTAFERLLGDAPESYRSGADADFSVEVRQQPILSVPIAAAA